MGVLLLLSLFSFAAILVSSHVIIFLSAENLEGLVLKSVNGMYEEFCREFLPCFCGSQSALLISATVLASATG